MTDTQEDTQEDSGSETINTPTGPTPHFVTPAIDVAGGIEAMDSEQLEALAGKIEQQRANRPDSLSKQIQALQDDLTGAHRGKEKAVDEKHTASDEANRMEAAISDIKATLRRTEFVEAATVAGFKAPMVVADHLARKDGEVSDLVSALAVGGAFAMVKPATSAPMGGPGSQTQQPGDSARQALVDEIRAAHGK